MKFGDFFRSMRAGNGQSLREFCVANGFDPGNISRLERGLLPPPESEGKLEEYAKALRIKKGCDEWYRFFDLAAAERGRLPQEVLEDHELVNMLPVLFRTLRGQRVDPDELDTLVERLRKV